MVRINHYDQIVKACGQEAGELVLRTTNSFLNAAVREMDLVGRYDPACFSLLLARTRLSEAAVVAERVRQAAASCDFARRGPAQFSLSQGFAEVTEGDDVVRLMQRAEEALAGAEQGAVACHNGLWAEPVANLSGAMLSR
jgi:diguanylate cyclase (GGDEF)-like protein